MTKFNLEKCKSGNKGITLIALVITIIVLLILAGITINALTGSDSAPAKANEAKQKNDIGTVKDEIAVIAQNAHLEAYDDIYVKNNSTVSSTAATTTVGQRVINAVLEHFGGTARGTSNANDTLTATATKGLVDVSISQAKDGNAEITLATRDFTQTGSISLNNAGVLTWTALTENSGGQQQSGGNQQQGGSGGNSGQGNTNQSGPTVVGGIASVNIGDKVAYTPPADTTIANLDLPEGTSIEGTKVAALENTLSGATITSSGVKAEDIKDWVVLDVDTTTGEILIVPDTVNGDNTYVTLELSGMDGYNNAIAALNKVAEQYKNPTYAKEARSITVDDVNKLEGYTPEGTEINVVFQNDYYGMNANLDIVPSSEAMKGTIETETTDPEDEEKTITATISGNLYRATAETSDYTLTTFSFLERWGLLASFTLRGSQSY